MLCAQDSVLDGKFTMKNRQNFLDTQYERKLEGSVNRAPDPSVLIGSGPVFGQRSDPYFKNGRN